jgi:glucokinase
VGKEKDLKRRRAFLGIDIGGTKSLYTLFDESFEVLAEEKLRTIPEKGGAGAFSRTMRKTVEGLMREAKRRGRELRVVGVGCAGDIDMRHGVVRSSPNLGFLDDYPMGRRLAKVTGAKVFVGNDVHAGLYGEMKLGAARRAEHVIGVFLGTGVGGALAVNGRLFLGAAGLAGDIGNYLLHAVDTTQEKARKDVLDNVVSRTAIAGDAAALAAKRWAPKLRASAGTDVTEIGAGDIAAAIRAGDTAVEKLMRSRAAVVGAAISNFVDFLNPDMVVLGGGITEAMPRLMQREVKKAVKAHAAPKAARAVRIVTAKLHDRAVSAGAAKLALDMYYPASGEPPIRL